MAPPSQQKIGVATATIVGMNAMIGAGIFAVPTALALYVGPAGIISYLFVITAVWFMARSLARLAELYPEEGSFYTYAKQWGGHWLGLAASFAYFAGLLIAMGLLCKAAGFYLHPYLPSYSPAQLGLGILVALTLLNMMGVAFSQLGQHILIVCTMFPLVMTTLLCLRYADLANLTPFAPFGLTNIFRATQAVIFGFFGFECAASLFNIVENPARNVPRALTYSIVIVGGLYLAFVTSIVLAVPLELFVDPYAPITRPLAHLVGHTSWILVCIGISTLSAVLGTLHSMIWSSSSLLITLSRKAFGASTRLPQPGAVLVVAAAILASFVFIENVRLFFNLTALCIVFAYGSSIITLLTLPSERGSKRLFIAVAGLFTAGIIFTFAIEGLLQNLGLS